MRMVFASLLMILFALTLLAQDTWPRSQEGDAGAKAPGYKVKVRVLAFKWDNAEEHWFDIMSPNQTDWWLKEGQKKFPGICITTTPGEADYLIAWTATESADTYTYTVPKTETTEHRGTVNTNSTSTSTSGPGAVYTSGGGTYSGTSTKTTYETKQGEWPVTYVNAFVHKLVDVEVDGQRKKKPEGIPSFVAKHKGQWRWSKPDKDAFEKSLKFIQKQLK